MRVHELAKELGVSSKDLLTRLEQLGVHAASHMAVIEDTAVVLMREAFAPPKEDILAEDEELELHARTHNRLGYEGTDESAYRGRTWSKTRRKQKERGDMHGESHAPSVAGKVLTVHGPVIVRELADKLGMRPNQVIAELMSMNILASITERVDVNIARKIAEKHGFTLEQEKRTVEHAESLKQHTILEDKEETDSPEQMQPRPPIVTFMGHVDHGKTSLLDRISNTSVAKQEHGGITQHIGAHTIEKNGKKITFLDTPGHAAFTQMRARGANLTDITVIVIAADDGIMPQTREAIQHARAANVALMAAINKIDLPAANIDRVKKQMQTENLAPEDWGGSVICVPVSAQTGEGIDHLLEMILIQADMMELRANPDRRATGYVIEAQMEPGMGPTVNLLVKRGTLNLGDAIVCGQYWGRVRALINDHGIKVKSAGPSTPVKCLGLSGVPEPGSEFKVCSTDKVARETAEAAAQEMKNLRQAPLPAKKMSLDSLMDFLKEDSKLELKVIIKADMQGSLEAILNAIHDIKSEKVALNVILASTGNVTVNDVMLASASNAVILGFHVGKEPGIDSTAKHEGVEIRLHHVIYEMVDQVRDAMMGLLKPELKERVIGHADIKQVFQVGKNSKIAGCVVTHGRASVKARVRVKRGDDVLFEGGMASMKHFQNDVSEVKESQECGIRLEKFTGFESGDRLEFYELEELERVL